MTSKKGSYWGLLSGNERTLVSTLFIILKFPAAVGCPYVYSIYRYDIMVDMLRWKFERIEQVAISSRSFHDSRCTWLYAELRHRSTSDVFPKQITIGYNWFSFTPTNEGCMCRRIHCDRKEVNIMVWLDWQKVQNWSQLGHSLLKISV